MAVSADVARLEADAPDYMRAMARYQRRNFVLLVIDGATFSFALSLLSETTIIPAFVQALSHSTLLVGLVAATFALGKYLPQLAGAHMALGRSRRKPLFVAIVIAERVGILAIAVSAQLVGVLPDGIVLVLFFLAFCGYAVTTGLIGPVYGDFVAKSLHRSRGWFYGIVQLVGGLLGFAAALVAQEIIRTNDFPAGNQICFWICFGLSFCSIAFVSGLREVPYPHVEPRPSFWTTLREIPRIVRADDAYARYLTARAVLALSTLGIGFVVVDGLSAGTLRPSDAALMAAVFVISQAVLGFLLGLVGNYLGWRLVIIVGGVLIVLGMVASVTAGSVLGYALAFVAFGGANAVTVIGDANMSIELAPTSQTSLYLGATATLLAPFFIVGPLVAGGVAGSVGYPPIFIAAIVLAGAGVLLALRIREPRHVVAAAPVGQPGTLP